MKLTKTNVNPLLFTSRNLKGFGAENQAIGTAFGLAEGTVSQPVIGNAAVFMIKLNSLTKASAPASYDQIINTLQTAFKQSVEQDQAYRALEESLDVVDSRIRFY
jgi:O-phosphoseryl-tRNA(Cys) synthetase